MALADPSSLILISIHLPELKKTGLTTKPGLSVTLFSLVIAPIGRLKFVT